ncbi:hypothetical protein [Bacteroides pyogenes]|uniref:hypothetical protein n=1 Tax=Bacteroides pyogenes TaxID=310300 RepID=UPI003F9F5B9F
MKEEKTKGNWGGKRDGSGRKRKTGRTYSYSADIDLVPVIDKQNNKNRFINDAVREKAKKDKLF